MTGVAQVAASDGMEAHSRQLELRRWSPPPAWPRDAAEGAPATVVASEGRELDQLALDFEARANDSLAPQAQVLAEPCRRLPALLRACRVREQLLELLGGRRLPVEPLERVEQVAGPELRPELRKGIRSRDGVQAHVSPDGEDRPALSRLRG